MNTSSVDFLEEFRTKFRETIDFIEVEARSFAPFQGGDDDQTWRLRRNGIAHAEVDGATLLELFVDLGPYRRAEELRPMDEKIGEAVSQLSSLIPKRSKVRLSLQLMNQRDPDCAQVKICIEAKP